MRERMPVEPVLRITREALKHAGVKGVARVVHSGSTHRKGRRPAGGLVLPPVDGPFHFTQHMSRLCRDISQRIPALQHIDMQRVLVTFARCRNGLPWGLQAKLVPLRFRNGEPTQVRRGHLYQVQKLFVGDVELQYVLSFYLPRFLDQSFDEKMITVLHELYHIGPDFTGDIRRFPGSHPIHDRNQREYDRLMATMAREYLALKPPRALHDFLRLTFAELEQRYGEVVGVHIPAPKLLPVPPSSTEPKEPGV